MTLSRRTFALVQADISKSPGVIFFKSRRTLLEFRTDTERNPGRQIHYLKNSVRNIILQDLLIEKFAGPPKNVMVLPKSNSMITSSISKICQPKYLKIFRISDDIGLISLCKMSDINKMLS